MIIPEISGTSFISPRIMRLSPSVFSSQPSCRVCLECVEGPFWLDRPDGNHYVSMIGPHIDRVQAPSPMLTDLTDCIVDAFALRPVQDQRFIHELPQIVIAPAIILWDMR